MRKILAVVSLNVALLGVCFAHSEENAGLQSPDSSLGTSQDRTSGTSSWDTSTAPDFGIAPRLTGAQGKSEAQQDQESQTRSNDHEPLQQASGIPPAVREPDIEFQRFVTQSVGSRLPIFGQNLFERTSLTFTPLDQVSVPAEYVVGPGDELQIQIWGEINTNFKGVVDRTGSLYMPTVGTLHVAGLKYEQLEAYLHNAISRLYKNFQLNVTLGKLRSIRVLVVGQVKRPGTYTISSLSTAVNALFAAGGPSNRGSMRNIQIRRGAKPAATLDLYDLIASGDESKDITLMPGDVIYVPPVGHLVALSGDVSIPAIYELKDRSTLGELLRCAGGPTDTTDTGNVLIERIDDHHARRVDVLKLDGASMDRELHGGDVIRFLPISPKFENAVTLRGNVAVPGRYPWREGMRVADLIPSREFLLTRNYWNRQNALSTDPPSTRTLGAQAHGSEELAAEEFPDSQTTLERSRSEINWQYAVIQRLDPERLKPVLVPFNLEKAIGRDDANNVPIQPGDVVTIFSQSDLAVPIDQRSHFVTLDGELKRAGVYEAFSGETLRHLVERAGGLTEKAYLYGAVFTRESARVEQQVRLDQYVRELQQEVERNAQRLSPSDPQAQQRLEAQRHLLAQVKELKATGRIVLRLKPGASSVGDLPNFELEDGDRLLIPFRPAVVSVIGSVYNAASFAYRPGFTVSNYIAAAGGVTRDSDKSRAFVVRADGSTVGRDGHSALTGNHFDGMRLMPGDSIVVPEKLNRGAGMQSFKDWTLIISQFTLGAAAASVLF